MSEIEIQEIRDWLKLPVTKLITREILELAVNAGENVYDSVSNNDIHTAQKYLGGRDAYKTVLGLAEEKIEELKEEES